MFEIREWIGTTKIVVKKKLANLGIAHVELQRLKIKNPNKTYSIYRSKEGRSRGYEDYIKQTQN